jgi:hypothetical protein
MVETVFVDFAAQCIAMNAQSLRRLRSIVLIVLHHLLYEPFLKLDERILVGYSVFNHLAYKSLKLVFHGNTPPG